MIIKVADIVPEGLKFEHPLSEEAINQRVSAQSTSVASQDYRFLPGVSAQVHLQAEGSTVTVRANVHAQYATNCSRCAEETEQGLAVKVEVILKPRPERGPVEAQDEDLHFGFYDDKEINYESILEEYLVLGIPYTVFCSDDCLGLCPQCGQNLNTVSCGCASETPGDERFAVLRNLKL